VHAQGLSVPALKSTPSQQAICCSFPYTLQLHSQGSHKWPVGRGAGFWAKAGRHVAGLKAAKEYLGPRHGRPTEKRQGALDRDRHTMSPSDVVQGTLRLHPLTTYVTPPMAYHQLASGRKSTDFLLLVFLFKNSTENVDKCSSHLQPLLMMYGSEAKR